MGSGAPLVDSSLAASILPFLVLTL